MPHYNSYESFKLKKSIQKKISAKNSKSESFGSKKDFYIDSSIDYGIVTETKYNKAYVLYKNNLILATLRKDINLVLNKVIYPGDKVIIAKENKEFVIKHLLKRKTILSRNKKDGTRLGTNSSNKIIATNIDIAVIVVACKEPPLHPKFIDRYLMVLKNSDINTIIVINKCELKTNYEKEIMEIYQKLGIRIIETSTYTGKGIEELKKHLRGTQAILVGNSGVGKSSLMNSLLNNKNIKTGNISKSSNRGKHTTTYSKYYVWEKDSSVIDTPGIRALDVSTFTPKEIEQYFIEFNSIKVNCKYRNCLHYREKFDDCAIKRAVDNGIITKDRYESYIRIIEDTISKD